MTRFRPEEPIVAVTTARSDYGPSRALFGALQDSFGEAFGLFVGGAHQVGSASLAEVEADGFRIFSHQPFETISDHQIAIEVAKTTPSIVSELERLRPALLLLYGDRAELLPFATAALLLHIPVAHLCGGDVTAGAIDDQVRHSLTKSSHLHFVAARSSERRVLQMGEENWRVQFVGDTAIDSIFLEDESSADELRDRLGFVPDLQTLLVTLHPTTLRASEQAEDLRQVLQALNTRSEKLIITGPAPDSGSDEIRTAMQTFAQNRQYVSRPNIAHTIFVESLGSKAYRATLKRVGAVVGNSSSGLIEAGAVPVPVVNIGPRQEGRDRGPNVVDCMFSCDAISAAIDRVLATGFRDALDASQNPYGDGHASARIVQSLKSLPSRHVLLRKSFVDRPLAPQKSA